MKVVSAFMKRAVELQNENVLDQVAQVLWELQSMTYQYREVYIGN